MSRPEVEQDLEPVVVVPAQEVAKAKVPMPGRADHGRLANEDKKQANARKPSNREVSAVRQIGAVKTSTATA